MTATDQYVPPEPIDALPEGAQPIDISRNGVVLVVAVNDLPKPCTDLTDTIMLPAEKLCLDGFQLRNHSLFRRNPPDGEGFGLVTPPAVVGEAQEREGLRFPFAPLFPFVGRKTPELDQPSLFRVKFQTELGKPIPELIQEPDGLSSMLKTQHEVVSVTDDDYIALRHLPAPDIHPQVEDVMQIHVSEQR